MKKFVDWVKDFLAFTSDNPTWSASIEAAVLFVALVVFRLNTTQSIMMACVFFVFMLFINIIVNKKYTVGAFVCDDMRDTGLKNILVEVCDGKVIDHESRFWKNKAGIVELVVPEDTTWPIRITEYFKIQIGSSEITIPLIFKACHQQWNGKINQAVNYQDFYDLWQQTGMDFFIYVRNNLQENIEILMSGVTALVKQNKDKFFQHELSNYILDNIVPPQIPDGLLIEKSIYVGDINTISVKKL